MTTTETKTLSQKFQSEAEKAFHTYRDLKDNFNKMAQNSPSRAIEIYCPGIQIAEKLVEYTEFMVQMAQEPEMTEEQYRKILNRALISNQKNLVSSLQSNPSRNLLDLQAKAQYIDILIDVLDLD
jgi:hypothetical protein